MKKQLALCLFTLACVVGVTGAARAQGTTNYPGSLDTATSLPQAVDQKVTYLTAPATSGAASLTVNSTAGVPTSGVLQVDSELMSYATASGTTFNVTRGFSGTTAAAHAANAAVRFPLVSAHVNGPRGAVLELEKKLGTGASDASSASTGYCLVKQSGGGTSWAACGGAPSGPAGGDLSGSYPNPTVTRVGGVDQTAAWTAYTPTVTPASGAFTSVSAAGRYIVTGKRVTVRVWVTITTAGTAGGYVDVSLPATARNDQYQVLSGVEVFNTGKVLNPFVILNTATVRLRFYDNSSPIASGNVLVAQGVYESQ